MVILEGIEKEFFDEIKHALHESYKDEDIDFVEFNYRVDLLFEKAWDKGLNKDNFQEILKVAVPEHLNHIRMYQSSGKAA